jgi:transcriptional regulator with XRE-family HTH domain
VSSTPVSNAEGPLTLREVARRAGVSTATVARVLQGGRRVAPETAARVQSVLADSGYRVNAVAQGLSRGTTRTIGHLLHVAGVNPFYSWVALGLQQRAAEHGYEVILYNSHGDPASEAAGVEVFLGRRVDAIVFTTALDPRNVEDRCVGGAGGASGASDARADGYGHGRQRSRCCTGDETFEANRRSHSGSSTRTRQPSMRGSR